MHGTATVWTREHVLFLESEIKRCIENERLCASLAPGSAMADVWREIRHALIGLRRPETGG